MASLGMRDGAEPAFSLNPLIFETFVCSMAMMSFVALAGPIARIIGLAPWQVGVAMTTAGFAWIVMSRFWGTTSDRRGRRPVLLFGLAGFAICYAALAIFIDAAMAYRWSPLFAFAGLVIGRTLTGIFYAAVPASSAALVADHVAPDRRAASMAAIGAGSAAGMVIGPGLTGLIAPISLSLPLYVTAILPAIAWLVLWRVLPRRQHQAPSEAAALSFIDPRLHRPMAVAFVSAFSVAVAQITVGFFAIDRLHLGAEQAARAAGIALALVGVALVLVQLVLQKLHWSPQKLIRFGAVISAIGFGSVLLAQDTMMLWTAYFIAAAGMGWVYPSQSALAANSVEAHEQGATAGTVAAAQGLGFVIGPLAGTAIYAVDNGAPYILIATMLFIAGLWPARGQVGLDAQIS